MIQSTEISTISTQVNSGFTTDAAKGTDNSLFRDIINHELKSQASQTTSHSATQTIETGKPALSQLERNSFAIQTASENIKKGKTSPSFIEQLIMYKEDQLLSKPGGDSFALNKETNTIDYDLNQSQFSKRVGKDLKDAGENIINIFKDVGAARHLSMLIAMVPFRRGEKSVFSAQ